MPESEFSLLITGIIFGLSGGLTPGPLFTLIVSETLKHGTREGIKISMVPIISDLPIVLFTLFIILKVSEIDLIIGVIALGGAIYLIFLAMEGIRFKGASLDLDLAGSTAPVSTITLFWIGWSVLAVWMIVSVP